MQKTNSNFEKLFEDRTLMAIAHRLSTIVRADKVVVFEQTRIVEQEKISRIDEIWYSRIANLKHYFLQ